MISLRVCQAYDVTDSVSIIVYHIFISSCFQDRAAGVPGRAGAVGAAVPALLPVLGLQGQAQHRPAQYKPHIEFHWIYF